MLASLTPSLTKSKGSSSNFRQRVLLLTATPAASCFDRFSQTFKLLALQCLLQNCSKGACPVPLVSALPTAPFAFSSDCEQFMPLTHTQNKNAKVSDLADLHKKCANLDKVVTPFCSGNRESLSVKHKRIIILYSSKEKNKTRLFCNSF